MKTMLLWIYRTALRAATPLLEAHLRRREKRGKEDPARANERRGAPLRTRGEKPLVWFHAASVGESISLLPVVQRLLKDYPGVQVMVTTGTVTSARTMADRLPQGAFHQYIPVDHPAWVARFLDHWRPDLVLWVESDFWPNMLTEIGRRKIPAVLLNGCMTEKSRQRWSHARGMISAMLSSFDLILAQNDVQARRIASLGIARVKAGRNLKYAALPLPYDEAKLAALKSAAGNRPVILWASAHPGEDAVALRLHAALRGNHPSLLTVIAPRHPQRAGQMRDLCGAFGLRALLRSEGALPQEDCDVYIADTMGEMGLFYRFAGISVVGGTFADIGGHNPIEPGQLGCVIFYGPMTYKITSLCEDFESRKAAVRAETEEILREKAAAFLKDPASFAPLGKAALDWTRENANVIDDVAAVLAPYMKKVAS